MITVARSTVNLCANAHDSNPGNSVGQWNLMKEDSDAKGI